MQKAVAESCWWGGDVKTITCCSIYNLPKETPADAISGCNRGMPLFQAHPPPAAWQTNAIMAMSTNCMTGPRWDSPSANAGRREPLAISWERLQAVTGPTHAMQSTVLQSVPHWPLVKLVCCITCHQSQPSMAPSHNSGLMNCFSNSMNPQQYDQGKYTHHIMSIMNSMKLVIPLHVISWKRLQTMLWHHNTRVNSQDESKCGSTFAFIFGVNWPVKWM